MAGGAQAEGVIHTQNNIDDINTPIAVEVRTGQRPCQTHGGPPTGAQHNNDQTGDVHHIGGAVSCDVSRGLQTTPGARSTIESATLAIFRLGAKSVATIKGGFTISLVEVKGFTKENIVAKAVAHPLGGVAPSPIAAIDPTGGAAISAVVGQTFTIKMGETAIDGTGKGSAMTKAIALAGFQLAFQITIQNLSFPTSQTRAIATVIRMRVAIQTRVTNAIAQIGDRKTSPFTA